MPGGRVQTLLVFLTPRDEEWLAEELRKAFPRLVFLDDAVWGTPAPVEHFLMGTCRSGTVLLWNKGAIPSLPARVRSDGRYEPVDSIFTVAYTRGRMEGTMLTAGKFHACFDDATEMARFVAQLWRLLKGILANDLKAVSPYTGGQAQAEAGHLFAGPDAVDWCRQKPGRFFKDPDSERHFQPLV